MPNNKKSPELTQSQKKLAKSKVSQLSRIFSEMAEIEAKKEIKLKQKRYEKSLVQRKR